MRSHWALFLAAALPWLTGCDPVKTYPTRGVVKEVRADGKSAVIAHEEIHGYMKAMTMPFEVRNTNELAQVKPGDVVEFSLKVTAKDGWMEGLKVVGSDPGALKPAETPETAVNVLPNVPALEVGDPLPDMAFTNQLGKIIRLSEFRGQVLTFSFIFTRCPFPTFCLRMTERFSEVQAGLKNDSTFRNWHLMSVSFDPDYDTPEKLREYGETHRYDASRWTLISGSFESISRLAGHFGLYFGRNLAPEKQNHNLRTVVVTPGGKVHQVFPGNEWTAAELMASMKAAANSK